VGEEGDIYIENYFIMKDIVKVKAKRIKNFRPCVHFAD
jgi:hypothetical protein